MGSVSANGIDLAYDDRGEGRAVVMVCGTGMPASMWDEVGLRPALDQAGFRTVAFDNRGIPPTSVPVPPYSIDAMASDTTAVIDHLELDGYFVLGASLGALVAQKVALRRADALRGVVLLVGGANFSRSGQLVTELMVAALRAGGDVAALAWRLGLLDAALTPAKRHDDDAIEFGLAALGGFLDVADWTGLLGQFEAELAWAREDHLSELSNLTVPSLLIGHEFDHIFSVETRRQAVERIPDAELVIVPGATHLDPAATQHSAATINSFLTSH